MATKTLKRFQPFGFMKRSESSRDRSEHPTATPATNSGSPTEVVVREIKAFCKAGRSDNPGDEVTHLPAIVDATESSPDAAREAASSILKYCGRNYWDNPSIQYNAVMLLRILSDHPGPLFTKYLDKDAVNVLKKLTKEGRDASVHHILLETLESLEARSKSDANLIPVANMWIEAKADWQKHGKPFSAFFHSPNRAPQPQRRIPSNTQDLPPPSELASRIEEARTSAKLLIQVVQTTPGNEIIDNALIKEFADRCQYAQRSMQGFMNAKNPPPDEDTLLTLIETNDRLAIALSKHQRAVLQSRKTLSAAQPEQPIEREPFPLRMPEPKNPRAAPTGTLLSEVPAASNSNGDAVSPNESEQHEHMEQPQATSGPFGDQYVVYSEDPTPPATSENTQPAPAKRYRF